MKLSKLLIVLSLFSCATGNLQLPPRAGDSNSKLVRRVTEFVNPAGWRASGYARSDDIETPVKVVLAGDETACPVYEIEIQEVRVNEYYVCKTQWRIRRP